MIVKLIIVVMIPESFITNGSNKHPDPIKVLTITKIVLEVEFFGTKKKYFVFYNFVTRIISLHAQLTGYFRH